MLSKVAPLPILASANVAMLVTAFAAFIFAPTHEVLGESQRIFYVHVAGAWSAYVAFAVVLVGSVQYLRTRSLKWDSLAGASGEVGLLFITFTVITGPIWALADWGVPWRFEDTKLTMVLVLWLTFVAYAALRNSIDDPDKRASLSAVFGIAGASASPLTFFANRIWNQYHPTVIASDSGSLSTMMGIALGISVCAFTMLYIYFLKKRLDVASLQERVEELKENVRALEEGLRENAKDGE